MEEAVEHVLQQLRAGAVALLQATGIALEAAGGLARQLVQTADVALAAGIRLEDRVEGVVLGGVRLAVGLG